MLNLEINNVFVPTNEELNHVNDLRNEYGRNFELKLGPKTDRVAWDDSKNATKNLKNRLSKHLLSIQYFKCAYCEKYLINEKKEIDHFGPKATNPRYMFEPLNLIYSCSNCNGTDKKGQKETLTSSNSDYSQCTFKILHPYLDNVDENIVYQDADKVYFDYRNCTPIGLQTIIFFKFHKKEMTYFRSKILVFQRKNPIASDEIKQLIAETSAYKKK